MGYEIRQSGVAQKFPLSSLCYQCEMSNRNMGDLLSQ